MNGDRPMVSFSCPCALTLLLPASKTIPAELTLATNLLRDICFMMSRSFRLAAEAAWSRPMPPGRTGWLCYDLLSPGACTREQMLGIGKSRELMISDHLAALHAHCMRVRSSGRIDKTRNWIGCGC